MKGFIRFILWLVILITPLQVLATEATSNSGQGLPQDNAERLISISMMTASDQVAAGITDELALIMTPKEGWHGYWRNPGDAGFPTRVDWHLPQGVTVGELAYPAPSQLVTSDIMNYIYHGEYALIAPLTIDKNIAEGTQLTIGLDISYLVCNPTTCLPEQQKVDYQLTVGGSNSQKIHQDQFNQWKQKLPKPLDAKASFAIDGDKFSLSLPLPSSIDTSDAHIYPLINQTIVNNADQAFSHEGDLLQMQTLVGEHESDVFQGVLVLNNGTALSFDANKVDQLPAMAMSGKTPEKSTLVMGTLAFFGAILGGLLLNIMPCVFPILSLKILSLSSHDGSEREAKVGAVAYTLGAVLVCVVLGGIILGLRAVGHQIGWAFQLQSPIVIAVLIVLMSAIAFNLAGLFEIGTLTSGSRLQDKKGPAGDFWTGVLAAFIATPCTGPFMATALGAALVLPMGIAFLIFAGLGFGMALPFLCVGFIPSIRTRLPRPGAWMLTARRILSLPMFITVLGLIWILMRQSNSDYVLAILAVTMISSFGFWLTGLWQQSQHKGVWWPSLLLTLIPLVAAIYYVPSHSEPSAVIQNETKNYVAFDREKLKELREKQDMFVYFTADWCLTCKVNEKTSIDRDEVQQAFKDANIVTMVGDWTNGDSEITAFLSEQGRSGVPLYLWYKKGVDTPEVLPQVLSPSILIDKTIR